MTIQAAYFLGVIVGILLIIGISVMFYVVFGDRYENI